MRKYSVLYCKYLNKSEKKTDMAAIIVHEVNGNDVCSIIENAFFLPHIFLTCVLTSSNDLCPSSS